jgi:hypothetical protein
MGGQTWHGTCAHPRRSLTQRGHANTVRLKNMKASDADNALADARRKWTPKQV